MGSERNPRRRRAWAFNLVVLGVCVVLAGGGYVVGRLTLLWPLRKQLEMVREGTSYGQLVKGDHRSAAARAYDDPDAARTDMDAFSWTVPNVMAPFVGHAPEPGDELNTHINPWLARSERPVISPKPAGVFRIFMTGASVLFGSGASSQEHTVGGYLQAALDEEGNGVRYEVLPIADPAWSSTHERIMIENRIAELDPDMVISLSGTGDIVWSYQGRDVLWFRSFADEIFFLTMNRLLERTGLPKMTDVAPVYPTPFPPPTMAERLETNVDYAEHALARRGATYVFALQPGMEVTEKALSPREAAFVEDRAEVAYYTACCEEIRRRLTARPEDRFHFVDLTGVFDELGADEEVFLDRYHFGDRGNRMVAAAILEAIRPWLNAGR